MIGRSISAPCLLKARAGPRARQFIDAATRSSQANGVPDKYSGFAQVSPESQAFAAYDTEASLTKLQVRIGLWSRLKTFG